MTRMHQLMAAAAIVAVAASAPASAQTPDRQKIERIVADRHDATVQALRTGNFPSGSLGYLVEEIAPAVREVGIDHPLVHTMALRRHVARTVARLSAVRRLLEASRTDTDHRIQIVGAVYDLDTGVVDLL